MYTPTDFRLDDSARLHSFVREFPFALLCTCDSSGVPSATHLPVLLAAGEGALGTFYGHLARANPQWQTARADTDALLVFAGPHAYISPTWYAAPHTVPTWNYSAVHVRGENAGAPGPGPGGAE